MTEDEVQAKNDELLRAYALTFHSPHGQTVLLDLMKHCHFRMPLPERGTKRAEGRREAFLRIMHFLNLTPEELGALVAGKHTMNIGGTE